MDAPVPYQRTPVDALCARHPSYPALATCSRCGSYACRTCYRIGADGQDYCVACDQRSPILAERGDRFVANLVDSFVIVLPIFIAGVMTALLSRQGSLGGVAFLLGALGTIGILGYQIVLAQNGQSIGKRMRNIRVVRTDGSPASLGRILVLRNLVPMIIGSFCGIFGLVDALTIFGDERRCVHDMLADTKVIQAVPEND